MKKKKAAAETAEEKKITDTKAEEKETARADKKAAKETAKAKEKAEKAANKAAKKEAKKEAGKKRKVHLLPCLFFLLFLPLLMCFLAVHAYGLAEARRLQCLVMTALLCLLLIFTECRSALAGDYLYNNAAHRRRFYLSYILLFGISCFFPLFTTLGWPLLIIAVIMTCFSNSLTGMVAYVSILGFLGLVGQVDINVFLTYFFSGLCAAVLFSVIDQKFRIELPLILSLLCHMVCVCANIVITQNANLSFQMFIVPLISLFLNTVMLFMFLWYVNGAVVNQITGRYQVINDPEFELMKRIKEVGNDYYYHAIHTAYLCNKIAGRLSMDPNAVRAAGFYHEAGIVLGEDTPENTLKILKEYAFPDGVDVILEEFWAGGKLKTREAAVLTMSAEVIDEIMGLFAADSSFKVKYDELISRMLENKTKAGMFDQCDITIREMNLMKKILIEENLYYDFLRR